MYYIILGVFVYSLNVPVIVLCMCIGQTDLLLEAKHLDMFNANFAGKAWDDCVFPRVVHAVEDVLVRRRAYVT